MTEMEWRVGWGGRGWGRGECERGDHQPWKQGFACCHSCSLWPVALKELVPHVGCQVDNGQLKLVLNTPLDLAVQSLELLTEILAASLDPLLKHNNPWPEGEEGEGNKQLMVTIISYTCKCTIVESKDRNGRH